MNPTRQIEAQCTHAEFYRNLPGAVDYRPFEIIDNRVIVHDDNRTINITVHDEPVRKLGSLKLPMEKIQFEFEGFTDEAADAFMEDYREHTFRAGGG